MLSLKTIVLSRTDLSDGFQCAVHIRFRGSKAQREPDGSPGEGVQCLVSGWGTVETAAGQNAEFRFQTVGNFCVVLTDKIQRNNTYTVFQSLRSAHGNSGNLLQPFQKTAA